MKEKIFGLFFKGMEEKVFEKLCGEFCEKRLANIVKKEIYEIFLKDLKEQDMVIIASASLEDYLLPFFKKYDEKVTVVGTKIEKKNGIITGRFVGKNCSKSEKVKRIIEVAYLGDAQVTIYTDGYNDEPLMSMGGEIHLTK
jgi:phosphoserine phosphatase